MGKKILLPTDLLSFSYPKDQPEFKGVHPINPALGDQVYEFEINRQFTASEFQAGRIPLWNPYSLIGAPFVVWGKYSWVSLISIFFPGPKALIWIALLKSLVASLGFLVFLQRVVKIHFFPALIGAWCYPLTQFFVLWHGVATSLVIIWFPWLLIFLYRCNRSLTFRNGAALTLVSLLMLTTGQLDMVALSFLGASLFWFWDFSRRKARNYKTPLGILAFILAAHFLAAPYLLPMFEYLALGNRILQRNEGRLERPPMGLKALPELFSPEIYGTTRVGSKYEGGEGNQQESLASGYVGLLPLLLLIPLCFAFGRYVHHLICFAAFVFLGTGWSIGFPPLVWIYQLPLLRLFSFNRFSFLASFALLSLSTIGLHGILFRRIRPRKWFLMPAMGSLMLVIAFSHRASRPNFQLLYLSAVIALVAFLVWIALHLVGRRVPRAGFWLISAILVGDLLLHAKGKNPQNDPATYYPKVASPYSFSGADPYRLLGINTLMPNLNIQLHHRDIRGYDSVEYAPYLRLLETARNPKSTPFLYSRLQNYFPQFRINPNGTVSFPGSISQLGVRYLLTRDQPVLVNDQALPRISFPRRVLALSDSEEILRAVSDPNFDPRLVAYVDSGLSLSNNPPGEARISSETPCEIRIDVDGKLPSFLILNDLWYPGWNAYWNGVKIPLYRTNYVLRGARLATARGELIFRFEPWSFRWGIILCGLTGIILLSAYLRARRRRASPF